MSFKVNGIVSSAADVKQEPVKERAKTSKSSGVAKKTLAKKPVSAPKALTEKKVYPFTPTKAKGEPWVKADANIGPVARILFNTAARPLIKSKLTEEGKELFNTLDFDELKTVGHIEKFALKVMKQEMTAPYERCEEVHVKLRGVLKVFAEKGMKGALSSIVTLIMNP